jgi:hypothetical protein
VALRLRLVGARILQGRIEKVRCYSRSSPLPTQASRRSCSVPFDSSEREMFCSIHVVKSRTGQNARFISAVPSGVTRRLKRPLLFRVR